MLGFICLALGGYLLCHDKSFHEGSDTLQLLLQQHWVDHEAAMSLLEV